MASVGALATGPVGAAEAACAALPATRVAISVRTLPTLDPPVDRSLPVLELTRKARDLGNRHARRGRVLGLTTAEFRFGVPRLEVTSVQDAKGGTCLRPSRIAVELEARQKVWVVRAQSAAPCWDEAILAHEMQHVTFNNDAIRRAGELLEPRLRALGEGAGITGSDADAAGEALAATVRRLVREATGEALAEAARRHASIDTADAYTQVRRACGL